LAQQVYIPAQQARKEHRLTNTATHPRNPRTSPLVAATQHSVFGYVLSTRKASRQPWQEGERKEDADNGPHVLPSRDRSEAGDDGASEYFQESTWRVKKSSCLRNLMMPPREYKTANYLAVLAMRKYEPSFSRSWRQLKTSTQKFSLVMETMETMDSIQ
jgi:hypothetical protein